MKNPLILIDGSGYLYRAFHALPPLITSDGQPTGAIYGVVRMLRKLLREHQPECAAVVFDTPGKTFRHDLMGSYKANRAEMPLVLQQQLEPLEHLVQALGFPVLKREGIEADDIIATLSARAIAQRISVLISSSDKDFAQLVGPYITLTNTMTDIYFDRQGIVGKFHVTPEQMIDYLALVGDSIDNIPGIPNVGPKTAVKWLNQYGNLEELIKHASEIPGRVGESLRAHLNQLGVFQKLLSLQQDLSLDWDPAELNLKPVDREVLLYWTKKLEFKMDWVSELPVHEKMEKDALPFNQFELILTHEAFEDCLQRIEQSEVLVIHIESDRSNPVEATLGSLSLVVPMGKVMYIPIAQDYFGVTQLLSREQILQGLKPFLEDANQAKVGHDLKWSVHVLNKCGLNLQGLAFDTLLAAYLLDSISNNYNLNSQAVKYLGYSFLDGVNQSKKALSVTQSAIEKAACYAAESAHVISRLHPVLLSRLEANSGLDYVFQNIEMPLIKVLARMESYGVLVDISQLKAQNHELADRIEELEKEAYQLVGRMFNLSSPKQLQFILYEQQGLPVLAKTPTGQPSTSESVLQALAANFPLPQLVLAHRHLSKLKSTYTEALPKQVSLKTGRIHTSYHQTVVSTGRLASSDPNLQNVPIRTEEGRKIRQAFRAPSGYKILSADYSQIELRIMAHFSQDLNLLMAFKLGLDIHRATAAEILGVALSDVSNTQRYWAKAINFGLIYGMSAFGLAKQLGVSRAVAQNYIETYFARYPGVKQYMDVIREQAHREGGVRTLFGRYLHLPYINVRNNSQQRGSERLAINAPLQGSAADIIKMAMITIDRRLQQQKLKAYMILQVHDELVFEVAEENLMQARVIIENDMIYAATLSVPLAVQIGIGDSWGHAH